MMHVSFFIFLCHVSNQGLRCRNISNLTISNSTFVDLRNIKQKTAAVLPNINLYVVTEFMEISILSNELNKAV